MIDPELLIVAAIVGGLLALTAGILLRERRRLAALRAAPVVEAPLVSPARLAVSTLGMIAAVGAFPAAALGLGFGPDSALPVTLATVALALGGVGAVLVNPWSRIGRVTFDGARLTRSQQGAPDVVIDLSRPWELVVLRAAERVSVAALQGEAAIAFQFVSYDAFEAGQGLIDAPDLGSEGRVLHERLVAAARPDPSAPS